MSNAWLAHELHDGLLQWVIGARLHLAAAIEKVKNEQPQTDLAIQRQRELILSLSSARDNLDTAVGEGRSLITYVERTEDPDQATDFAGLRASLAEFITRAAFDAAEKDQTIEAHLDLASTASENKLNESKTWNFLRIAQQAIRNSIEHAGPTRIEVWLSSTDNDSQIVLSVRDFGRGFEPETWKAEPNHFGIISMRHRAQLMGAKLTIESHPSSGCTVTCKLHI